MRGALGELACQARPFHQHQCVVGKTVPSVWFMLWKRHPVYFPGTGTKENGSSLTPVLTSFGLESSWQKVHSCAI